jgi:FixJ family two-component response regulator
MRTCNEDATAFCGILDPHDTLPEQRVTGTLPIVYVVDDDASMRATLGSPMPILFVTGHGDVAMSVQAMKAGAVDFLAKPFRDQDMLDAIHDALERDAQRRREEERLRPLRHSYARLSLREREVMHLVITGLLNKQIAGALDVSEDCVKLHRSQVMKKMNSRSVPDLVRKAKDLGINPRC